MSRNWRQNGHGNLRTGAAETDDEVGKKLDCFEPAGSQGLPAIPPRRDIVEGHSNKVIENCNSRKK